MKVKKGSCSIKPIYAMEKTLFITRVIRAVQTIIDKILVTLSLMKNVKLMDNEITNIEKTIPYTLIQYSAYRNSNFSHLMLLLLYLQ